MLKRRQLLRGLALAPLCLHARPARAAGPRLLMVGDSLIAGGFGPALQGLLEHEGFEIDRHGKVASGLARPDFYDWFSVGPERRSAFSPDAVLVMFGGNDRQALFRRERGRERWIAYGSDAWEPEYRRRINHFARTMAPAGERLIWIGMPQMRRPDLREHVDYVNDLFRAEMAIRPNARFVDIWNILAQDGEFTEHLEIDGREARVRTADGVHITRDGGQILADFVRPRILRLFDRGSGE